MPCRAATSMTVVLTTHYIEEADAVCDRVALMHLGRLQALSSPRALRGLLIGTPTNLWLDFGVLWLSVVLGIFGAPRCCPASCADRPSGTCGGSRRGSRRPQP